MSSSQQSELEPETDSESDFEFGLPVSRRLFTDLINENNQSDQQPTADMATKNTPPPTGRHTRSKGAPEPTGQEDDEASSVSLHDRIDSLAERQQAFEARMDTRLEQMLAAITALARPAATVTPDELNDLETRIEDRLQALQLANDETDQNREGNRNGPPPDPVDINIYRPRPAGGYSAANMAIMAGRVRTFLPRARTAAQVDEDSRPDNNLKKQIRWTTDFYIQNIEDQSTLKRIQAVENELFESLIPYRVWPQRILTLLKNDFLSVREYLENNTATTWIETLLLIGTLLRQGTRHHEPWYTWIHIHPSQGEQQIGYAQRIREAFHGLSPIQKQEPQTREHLVRLIRDAFATIWGNIQHHQHTLMTAELIDDLVRRTTNGERRAVESTVFSHATVGATLQGAYQPFPAVRLIPGANAAQDKAVLEYLPAQNPQAATLPSTFDASQNAVPQNANLISDPRTDERTVSFAQGDIPDDDSHALAVGDGNCHNCGKPGHWAKDCRQPQQARRGGFRQFGNTNTYNRHRSDGDPVTIKDATITGKLVRAFQAARRPFQGAPRGGSRGRPPTGRGGNRGGRRQYAITNNDYEVETMEYGVTTDNPDMVNDLLNTEEASWNQYDEYDYEQNEEAQAY
jgi:hypothetical protein